MEKEILTVDEAAKLLRISRRKLYMLIGSGEGPPSKLVGRQRRFVKQEVFDWLTAEFRTND